MSSHEAAQRQSVCVQGGMGDGGWGVGDGVVVVENQQTIQLCVRRGVVWRQAAAQGSMVYNHNDAR